MEMGEIVENLVEKSKFPNAQQGKFEKSLNGITWTPSPKIFFNLLQDNILSPIEFSAALSTWNFTQSNQVRGFDFSLSRKQLSKISNIGERQAGQAIKRLASMGLLKLKSRRIGVVDKYAWNVDRFFEIKNSLYPTGTGTCTPQVQHLYPTGTAPVPQGYNVYIVKLIKHIKLLKTLISDLENSVDKSKKSKEMDGQDWPGIQMDAALVAAVDALWCLSPRGGTYHLNDIQNVIMANLSALNEVSNVTEYLKTLLSDEEGMLEMRQKFPLYCKSEFELFKNISEMEKINSKGVVQ